MLATDHNLNQDNRNMEVKFIAELKRNVCFLRGVVIADDLTSYSDLRSQLQIYLQVNLAFHKDKILVDVLAVRSTDIY